jgi:hypothetical protein
MNRTIRTEADRQDALRLIQARHLPFTLSIAKGAKRSVEQNNLQHRWFLDAEMQGDKRAEGYRRECKLHCGVPILRAEDEEFREKYDRIIRPLPYEQKLELMGVPFDFPVTRLMSVDQKRRYLDDVSQRLTSQGIRLTEPEHA